MKEREIQIEEKEIEVIEKEIDIEIKNRSCDRDRERSRSHHNSRSRLSSYKRYNKLYNPLINRSHLPRYSNSESRRREFSFCFKWC